MTISGSSGIERELAPGERLLWKGRPQRGIKFRSQDVSAIPIGLVWCAFVIFGTFSIFSHPPSDPIMVAIVMIFPIVFGLVGFHLLIGRFVADAYTRSRMEYALTDRRALLVYNTFSRRVRSIDYRTEPNISLSERSDGGGTIYFGEPQQRTDENGIKIMSSSEVSAFEFIDNARDVYQRILKAKEKT